MSPKVKRTDRVAGGCLWFGVLLEQHRNVGVDLLVLRAGHRGVGAVVDDVHVLPEDAAADPVDGLVEEEGGVVEGGRERQADGPALGAAVPFRDAAGHVFQQGEEPGAAGLDGIAGELVLQKAVAPGQDFLDAAVDVGGHFDFPFR